jgi:hypothetical protein
MMHDTEDKHWWVVEWRNHEDLFVNQVCPHLNLAAQINPAKKHDEYAPDLIIQGRLADLKCQQTPFFKSAALYRIDPQFAVTFNRKDYLRYLGHYPNLVVYYWLGWQKLEKTIRGQVYRVKPMTGVWRAEFQTLHQLIENGKAPLHLYQRRVNDTHGNAKDSYVFDVRQFECLYQRCSE